MVETGLRSVVGDMDDTEIVKLFGDVLPDLAKQLGIENKGTQIEVAQRIKMKLKSI